MPKKWVRDARRKAREEAYRGIGGGEGEDDGDNTANGDIKADPYEAQRILEQAVLPTKRTPVTWLMCETKWSYFRTLLVMADESREHVMNSNLSGVKLSEEVLLQISLLRVATSSWLVRSTKVLTHMAHCDFPKEDYSLLEIATTIKITHVGNSSLELEHDVILLEDRKLPKRLATISGTIVPYDPIAKKPKGEMDKEMRDQMNKFVVSSRLQIPRRVDIPSWLVPGGPQSNNNNQITKRGEARFSIRYSDCDAFLHLNNCHAVSLFVDAFLRDAEASALDRVAFIYLDYALPADANATVVVRSAFSGINGNDVDNNYQRKEDRLVDTGREEEEEDDDEERGRRDGFRWCGAMNSISNQTGEEKALLRAYFTSELDGLSSAL